MTQSPTTYDRTSTPPRAKTGSGCFKWFAFGCLTIIVVVAIGIFLVLWNIKSLATSAGTAFFNTAINQAQLTDEQKQLLTSHVNQLAQNYKNGTLTLTQVNSVFEEFTASPIIPIAMIDAFNQQHIQPSAMTAEEKQQATRVLQRLSRGLYEKSITQSELEAVSQPIVIQDASGELRFKQNPTDEELRLVLAGAHELANRAGVPDEAFHLDYEKEFEAIVRRVLGTSAPATPGAAAGKTPGETSGAGQP